MSQMWQERLDSEFNYMVANGYLVAGGTNGTYKLSAKGLAAYDRLFEFLSAESQVFVSLKMAGNADTTTAAIKAFMK